MHPAYTSAILLGALGAVVYSVYCYLTSQNENERYSYVDVSTGDERRGGGMGEDYGSWGVSHRRSNENGYRCTICQDTEEGVTEALKCSHEFHVRCIQRWLSTSRRCPLCRAR